MDMVRDTGRNCKRPARLFCVQYRGAVRAAGRVDSDLRLAERADLRRRRRGLGFGVARSALFDLFAGILHHIKQLDDEKQHDRRQQEVDDRRQKRAVADLDLADLPDQIVQMRVGDKTDNRRKDIADERVHNRAERRADDYADREIDDVALADKVPKFPNSFFMLRPFFCKQRFVQAEFCRRLLPENDLFYPYYIMRRRATSTKEII